MTITLTGANQLALRLELDKLKAKFIPIHGDIAVERLNGDEATFERLQESLQSSPFLASKKLVILYEPSLNKQFTEVAEQLLAHLPETTDVVVVEPTLDKRSRYYKFLTKFTDLRELSELDEAALARWLHETAKAKGGQLNVMDARFLIDRVGLNQQLLANELEKLLLYDPLITQQTISLLVEPTPQSTIFQLLEAAFAGDIKRALELYRDQREQKIDPSQIIAMLAWQLRVLAIIKVAAARSIDEIAKNAKLNPFVIRKSQSTARRLGYEQLKNLISTLTIIDTRSKRESIDLDEALQLFLLQIAT